jgi:hypothetical protein
MLGENGRETVNKEFSQEKIFSQVDQLYKVLMGVK